MCFTVWIVFLLLGQCAAHFYDDEYSCISDVFSIPHRQNIVKMQPLVGSDIEASFQLRNADLQWVSSSTTFFLGFFFDSTNLSNPDYANKMEIVAYIKEEG